MLTYSGMDIPVAALACSNNGQKVHYKRTGCLLSLAEMTEMMGLQGMALYVSCPLDCNIPQSPLYGDGV